MVDRRWQVYDLLEAVISRMFLVGEVYTVGQRIIENDIEPWGDEVTLELKPIRQLGIGPMGKQRKDGQDEREEYRELYATMVSS